MNKFVDFTWNLFEGRYNSVIGSCIKAFAAILAILSYSSPYLLVLSAGIYLIGNEVKH